MFLTRVTAATRIACAVRLQVVEHVDNQQDFISTCLQCVDTQGGSMFVSTMNRTKKSYLMAILGAEYVLRLLPAGEHSSVGAAAATAAVAYSHRLIHLVIPDMHAAL